MFTIADKIYIDGNGNKLAIEFGKRIVLGSVHRKSTNAAATTAAQGDSLDYLTAWGDKRKGEKAHSIKMHLKYSKQKFSWDLKNAAKTFVTSATNYFQTGGYQTIESVSLEQTISKMMPTSI